MMRMGMMYHLTLLHLLTIPIRVPNIGHHTIITSNLNSLTSYSTGIRCLLGISISCSTSGLDPFSVHNDEAPFKNTADLYNTIDSTPLGDIPWETFSLQHNGTQPGGSISSWMQAEYDVWFRDPHILVQNLLSNPNFKCDFNYVPFQEYTTEGVHCF